MIKAKEINLIVRFVPSLSFPKAFFRIKQIFLILYFIF